MATPNNAPNADGKASDLINAAIWIFIVSGFGIVTSGCYVSGLSTGLGFDFSTYFGVKDYLEVTPYWLLPILIIVLVLIFIFYRLKLEGKDFGRPIRDFSRRRLLTLILIALILLGLNLISPILLYGLLILGFALVLLWFLNSRETEDINRRLVGSIRSNAILWPGVTLLFTLCIVAYLVGYHLAPGVFRKKPMSTIYLAGSNDKVKGRVVFSLTKYLLAMREDPKTVVAIPVAKIDRIETPIEQATSTKTAQSLSMSTQTPNAPLSPPAQSSAPVSATPAPKLSPVPTLAPSPKPSLSPK